MPHGLDLAQRARILELADRRVIVRHLVDAAIANLVQPGIAHVREAAPARVDDGQGDDTRHAVQRRVARRRLEDGIVGPRDGLPQPVARETSLRASAP